ncbi:MAG: tripartite tricarboxylate transporter substrate binding protein [Betaproteobacteria bacterium]|nr:tripartite tricarboxylate transporter substrate binding protein [Betaproteobacteria bacterium]
MSRSLRPAACRLVAAMLIAAATHAAAQGYPAKPVRMIVPSTPGGSVDTLARIVAQKMTASLGQQVVVENRAGSGGVIGTEIAAKSAPDGYTLLDAASSQAVNAVLHKLSFDTLRDFAPITMLMLTPNFLVAHPSLPIKTVPDLIRLAKAHPGQITFASAGVGSAPHMAGELFKSLAKVDLVHVPYKGGGPVFVDLIGGYVQLSFLNIASSLVHVRAGKVRGIAVTSSRRSRSAPEFPTIAESGVPGYEIYEWNALFAPAGTPPGIIARLNAEIIKIMAAPDVQERLFQLGAEAATSTPEQLGDRIRREIAKWGKVVKDMGIKAN